MVVKARKEGLVNLFRKSLKLCFIYFFSILLLPIIFIIRIVRPFILIRFSTLKSDRIGHYAANTEIYLCERDASLSQKHSLDFFFNTTAICNNQLKKMWGRTLYVLPLTRLQRPLYIANRFLPGYKEHIINLDECRDINGLYEKEPSHLFFTFEEEKRGCMELQKMGIQETSKFVCFHARDSCYLGNAYQNDDWSYHNYRDSNIDNYIPAMDDLVKRGYYTFRMGALVNKSIRSENQGIIDYAKKYRTDFLDIFLSAKCDFFVSSCTGIGEVPRLFRKPMVLVNSIPLEYTHSWGSKFIIIFKKLWLKKERRFMTFREIIESGAGRFYRTQQYEQAGIEVVENTPEEIRDVAVEMDERLKGTWQTTEEDEELQQRFWSLFKSSDLHGVIKARIGRDFLRQNKDLLE